jgi:chromosome segregation ATPase
MTESSQPATQADIRIVGNKIDHLAEMFSDWKEARKADHDAITRMSENMSHVCEDVDEGRVRLEKLEASKADRTELVALAGQVKGLADSIDKFSEKLEAALGGLSTKKPTLGDFAVSGASGGGTLGLLIFVLYAIARWQGWL